MGKLHCQHSPNRRNEKQVQSDTNSFWLVPRRSITIRVLQLWIKIHTHVPNFFRLRRLQIYELLKLAQLFCNPKAVHVIKHWIILQTIHQVCNHHGGNERIHPIGQGNRPHVRLYRPFSGRNSNWLSTFRRWSLSPVNFSVQWPKHYKAWRCYFETRDCHW